jgi:hypothetical protein
MGVCGWLLNPIARGLGERLRGHRAVDADLQAFRDDVVQELQQTRREVAELSERLDFAERLLAKPRE